MKAFLRGRSSSQSSEPDKSNTPLLRGKEASAIRDSHDKEERTINDSEDELHQERNELLKEKEQIEARCARLEESLEAMRRQQLDREKVQAEKERKRQNEDREIVSTMKMMKDYIGNLERENEDLSVAYKQQFKELKEAREKAEAMEKADSSKASGVSSSQKRHEGVGLRGMVGMANKLTTLEKENSYLKEAIIVQKRKIHRANKEKEQMEIKLEEVQADRDRLSVKCMSLEQVALSLVKESETPKADAKKKDEMKQVATSNPAPEDNAQKIEKGEDDTKSEGEAVNVVDNEPPKSSDESSEKVIEVEEEEENGSTETSNSDGSGKDFPFDEFKRPANDVSKEEDTEKINNEMKSQPRRQQIIVETVDEFSDDEEEILEMPSSRPVDVVEMIPTAEQILGEADDMPDSEVSVGESRDQLGPLPSNPFSSFDNQSLVGSDAETSFVNLEDMQDYLKGLAKVQSNGPPGVAKAAQPDSGEQGATVADARLEILHEMEKHHKWKDRLFRLKFREQKTSQLEEAMLEGETEGDIDGVWC